MILMLANEGPVLALFLVLIGLFPGKRKTALRKASTRLTKLERERKIRLVYPMRRTLSHAAKAFLELVEKDAAQAVPAVA